jgi:hypothetical protein
VSLPFTHDAFLNVFAAYNASLWPVVAGLWVLTAAAGVRWLWKGCIDSHWLFVLLALHWAWSGLVYHALFFRPINPAATIFAAAFVVQAAVFGGLARTTRRSESVVATVRGRVGVALVLYGIAYPVVVLASGLRYPAMPVFAVPCPTTLVTAGWLLNMPSAPRLSLIIPLSWAIVGSTAAFTLGVAADLALVAAGAILAIAIVKPSAV